MIVMLFFFFFYFFQEKLCYGYLYNHLVGDILKYTHSKRFCEEINKTFSDQ